ncbi:MAG: hypothetical protein ACJ8OJ_10525 [Povalibacter sp.]
MNRRLLKLLTLWMLPLLVARAIVPVGFMFMAHADGLRLMFCPSVVQTLDSGSQAHDHAAHFAHSGEHDAGMHALHTGQHASGEPGSNDAGHDKTPCPFSLVASAALVDVPYVAIHAALIADRFRFFQALPARTVDPSFDHHIRGPPSFS